MPQSGFFAAPCEVKGIESGLSCVCFEAGRRAPGAGCEVLRLIGEVALKAGVLRRAVALGGTALAICVAAALPGWADTLDQALIKAYQNNPQLNSQRAVVRQTDE